MPRNPKRRGTNASQSFRSDEVKWLDSVLKAVLRGGDTRELMQREQAVRVLRKVRVMQASLKRQLKEAS